MFRTPHMRAVLLMAATTAGLGCAAVPAAAKTSQADQNSTRLTIEQRDGKTVYCVTDTITGSHLPREICQDRADWARDGLVIPERGEHATNSGKPQQPGTSSAGGGEAASVPSAPTH